MNGCAAWDPVSFTHPGDCGSNGFHWVTRTRNESPDFGRFPMDLFWPSQKTETNAQISMERKGRPFVGGVCPGNP